MSDLLDADSGPVDPQPAEHAAIGVVTGPDAGRQEDGLRLVRTGALGVLATTSVVVGALTGGRSFETHLPGAWFFGMPGGPLGSFGSNNVHPPVLSLFMVYGGLLLLIRVWYGLLRQLSHHHGVPVKKIVCVIAIWTIPLLLAPPLFSRDVYTYAGQGEMVSHQIDPYDYGTGVLGTTPFSTLPDASWTNTPSPYGPTFLSVDGLLNDLSGHQVLVDIALLRLLEVAGLAMMVGALPTLARRYGRDPAQVVLLGVGCPMVLMSLIGGAHNDAMMLGLLLAGLAVAQRFGTVPGIVLCAAAAGVKSPAALGVLFLGWVWAGPGASWRRRIGHALGAGLIAASTLGVISAISGIDWGWIRTTTAADRSFTAVTPIDGLSEVLTGLAHLVRLPIALNSTHDVMSVLGLTCAAGIGIWLLVRVTPETMVRNLGITLLVVALLGPILWAWYVTWGVLVLAPMVTGNLRRAILVITTFETFSGATSVRGVVEMLLHTDPLVDLMLLAGMCAVAIMPLAQFGRPGRQSPVKLAPLSDQLLMGATA
jgi:alpha-1,6-mannosyltransferase